MILEFGGEDISSEEYIEGLKKLDLSNEVNSFETISSVKELTPEMVIKRQNVLNYLLIKADEDYVLTFSTSPANNGGEAFRFSLLNTQFETSTSPSVIIDVSLWNKTDSEIIDFFLHIPNSVSNPDIDIDKFLEKSYLEENCYIVIFNRSNKDMFAKYNYFMKDLKDLGLVALLKVKVNDLVDNEEVTNGTILSITLSEDMIQKANVDPEDLYNKAIDRIKDEYSFSHIAVLLESMLGDMEQYIDIDDLKDSSPNMYVLSNKDNTYGASSILSRDVLENARNELNSSIITILPSSVHEVIVLGETETDMSKDELIDMVTEINANVVGDNEVLINCIYTYDGTELQILE